MWINTTTLGEFVLHADIRYELWKSNTEAPGVLTDEYLASVGYQVLTPVYPAYDPITQGLSPRPGALVNGVWEKHYTVIALDPAIVANNSQTLTELTPEITAILQAAGLLAPIQARVKVNALNAVRATAQAIILAKYPLWVQSNYSLGIYSQPNTDAMKAAIASVITESNRLEDAITAGTPATPNWPVI